MGQEVCGMAWPPSLSTTWHARWEVLNSSHMGSGLMPHVSLVLLFGGLVPSDPSGISRWLPDFGLPKKAWNMERREEDKVLKYGVY